MEHSFLLKLIGKNQVNHNVLWIFSQFERRTRVKVRRKLVLEVHMAFSMKVTSLEVDLRQGMVCHVS